MAPTGIDRIELTLGTYRAFLIVSEAMDMGRAKRVVTAWKASLFKGATLATRDATSRDWAPISLASVCAMFEEPKAERARKPLKSALLADGTLRENATPAQIKAAMAAMVGEAPAPVAEAPAAPAPKAAKKTRAKVASAPVVDAPPVVEAPAPAPLVAPAAPAPQPLVLFTVGFEGGISPTRMAEIVTERSIDLVVDIRSKANSSTAYEIRKLRALWGDRYTTKSQLKGGIAAILPRLKVQGSARVLLLRKEEAPGDHWASLELGRLAIAAKIPCIHLFQNEEVEAIELQRAIDLDIQRGGDHYYACDVETDDLADARDKARTRIAKLDKLAKGNANTNESKSAAAEATRLRAQFGIREAA